MSGMLRIFGTPRMVRFFGVVFVSLFLSGPGQARAELGVEDVGPAGSPAVSYGGRGLSGLTYTGSDWYAVDDDGAIVPMTINLNLATGAVSSASAGSAVSITGDTEGIAWFADGNGGAGSLFVSNETGPAISQYTPAGESLTGLTVADVYSNATANRSLESLTISPDGQSLWTANEEALTVDGGPADMTTGTTVRLGRFERSGASFTAGPQYAYVTEPYQSGVPASGEANGVVDVAVAPDGTLLVLERQVTGNVFPARFENRIYAVDLAGATDVSSLAGGLDGETYTSVSKTLLWSGSFDISLSYVNYEGLAVGPQLADGSYSLLLISDADDQSGLSGTESIYALKLTGVVPEPATLGLLLCGAGVLLRRRRSAR
jgi:hypothetical protein